MSTDNSITVPWPPLALGEAGWRYRLESIANQAEALIGRKVVSMQATAELALELFGLIWPAYGPETIAASARASLLLNTPVVMASAPADQLQEIAERLDAIWEAAQSDPAAAVVTVPAPLLNLVREPQSRPGRRKAADRPADSLELEVTEPTAEPDPEPAPDPVPPPRRPVEPLRPASERMVRRPDPVELPEPWRSSEPEPWPPMAEPEPEVTPAPEAPRQAILSRLIRKTPRAKKPFLALGTSTQHPHRRPAGSVVARWPSCSASHAQPWRPGAGMAG